MTRKNTRKHTSTIQCSEEAVNHWLYDSTIKWVMEGRCKSADDVAMLQLNRFMMLSMEEQALIVYKAFHDLYKEVDGI